MVRSWSEGCALGSAFEFGLGMRPAMVSAGRVPEENDVVSLVSAAREGDRGAFGRLYERYARMVHGILLGRGAGGDGEELGRDGVVRGVRRGHKLRGVDGFGVWVCSAARK